MSPGIAREPSSSPRCQVLVIDDSSFVRKLLSVVLADLGCQVSTSPDGRAGLDLALSTKFDIVVVDKVLPLVSGRDVCLRLASLPSDRKPFIIFQSISLGSYQERSDTLAAGADVLLSKEAGAENIVARVRRYLDSRRPPEGSPR